MSAPGNPLLAGIPGPVLVLADNEQIARSALQWAAAFAASGQVHRVRLVCGERDQDIQAVVAEARNLGAATLLVVGIGCPLTVGQAAAEQLGLPLVHRESSTHA